jgi:hypothetical protein
VYSNFRYCLITCSTERVIVCPQFIHILMPIFQIPLPLLQNRYRYRSGKYLALTQTLLTWLVSYTIPVRYTIYVHQVNNQIYRSFTTGTYSLTILTWQVPVPVSYKIFTRWISCYDSPLPDYSDLTGILGHQMDILMWLITTSESTFSQLKESSISSLLLRLANNEPSHLTWQDPLQFQFWLINTGSEPAFTHLKGSSVISTR